MTARRPRTRSRTPRRPSLVARTPRRRAAPANGFTLSWWSRPRGHSGPWYRIESSTRLPSVAGRSLSRRVGLASPCPRRSSAWDRSPARPAPRKPRWRRLHLDLHERVPSGGYGIPLLPGTRRLNQQAVGGSWEIERPPIGIGQRRVGPQIFERHDLLGLRRRSAIERGEQNDTGQEGSRAGAHRRDSNAKKPQALTAQDALDSPDGSDQGSFRTSEAPVVSLPEALANRFQLPPTMRGALGIVHFQRSTRVEDDPRHKSAAHFPCRRPGPQTRVRAWCWSHPRQASYAFM